MTISNITSGFRSTSTCPFDKDILTDVTFAPSLSTQRLEALNEEVYSDYDADDYLPLATLFQKLNTAENSLKPEVLPTPDLVKSENTYRRKALNNR
ncbi:hypothetical protein Trydic_g23240 [Trypoxylus dichotomus]